MTQARFCNIARAAQAHSGLRRVMIPLGIRLLGDQLTPVLAYRRLVVNDRRDEPSFLLESVEGGQRVGRYSLMGAHPAIEVVATVQRLSIRQRGAPPQTVERCDDPLAHIRELSASMELIVPDEDICKALPNSPWGGWFGWAGYDSVRYAEPGKLPFAGAPHDDRHLPDVCFGFYDEIVVFDHAETLVHIVRLVGIDEGDDPAEAYDEACQALSHTADALQVHSKPLQSGQFDRHSEIDWSRVQSNIERSAYQNMVSRAKRYIREGDIFQVVLGQRFSRSSVVDPFDVYRALRAINPSPYMGYLQGAGCILVASSPEILCRVERDAPSGKLIVTNRPLAGTRGRGSSRAQDIALERELLADQKERAEHIMLVDLGRNDVGRVSSPGSVRLPELMQIERYSHVMHISSTVQGEIKTPLDSWDALRAALPVGTISGAPKIRAMQIIDELESVRRGPYGGGFGYVGLRGEMDIALTLRTIVVPFPDSTDEPWTYHVQAAGGIVADSNPDAEFEETVKKASALLHAIEVAERAFGAAPNCT